NVDRAVRPERNAIGESLDIGKVQSEVAEIERGLNANILPLEVKEPTKGAKRENRERKSNQAKPNRPILSEGVFSQDRGLCRRSELAAGRVRPTGGPDGRRGD